MYKELTEEQVHSACMSYRHDYGLMTPVAQAALRSDCIHWNEALSKLTPGASTDVVERMVRKVVRTAYEAGWERRGDYERDHTAGLYSSDWYRQEFGDASPLALIITAEVERRVSGYRELLLECRHGVCQTGIMDNSLTRRIDEALAKGADNENRQ